jgi:dTDP-4-amino-4,6-dideoxygalactose transaminase
MEAFSDVYDSNWFLLGRQLSGFESAYASFNHVRHCLGVSNGLDALRIALATLNIRPGDEVILPANTFIATALAVLHAGATPVFADPSEQTYNIGVTAIEQAITQKTRAVIPVHLYGQPCDMPPIMQLARQHSLHVIEDNAQAQGARFVGKLTGSWGDINATSFYPGKNLGALGDAGGITTDDEQLAQKAAVVRNYGAAEKYRHTEMGFNMRMDECQAAFLSIKLKYLMDWTEQKRTIAAWYDSRLQGIGDIITPFVHPDAYHVYHLYVIRTARREELKDFLAAKGIATLIHYPVPLHKEKIFTGAIRSAGRLPISESLAASCLSLPLWVGMQEEEVDRVCTGIINFFK